MTNVDTSTTGSIVVKRFLVWFLSFSGRDCQTCSGARTLNAAVLFLGVRKTRNSRFQFCTKKGFSSRKIWLHYHNVVFVACEVTRPKFHETKTESSFPGFLTGVHLLIFSIRRAERDMQKNLSLRKTIN